MSCDLSALTSLDPTDPDQANQLLQECTAAATDPTLWFWTIAFTVVGAVVGAWIGKRKNAVTRDAILGATLGPIGWIISWCLPAPKPKPTCPACKGEVGAGDAHCRHCGAKLRSSGS
jgi:hypothetical protein